MARQKEEAEWITAGEKGDAVALTALIAKKSTKPDAPKACEALVCASAMGHVAAMRILLEWGVSPDCKDQVGRPALHAACEAGIPESIPCLVEHGVDTNSLDFNGCTPFQLAIRNKKMPCCKELLLGGAPLPAGETAPGLAAIIKEVQLEKLTNELKAHTDTQEVTQEEINAADPRAWECQREHMRLLRCREEQKAGRQLINFDRRAREELQEAERSISAMNATDKDVREKKVELQTLRGNLVILNRDVSTEQNEEERLEREDAQLRAEIQERLEELQGAESEVEASRNAQPGEEARIVFAEDRWHRLEEEIAEQRAYNSMEVEELEEAQKEFERWQRDREAAAKLTAQAHKLLGN